MTLRQPAPTIEVEVVYALPQRAHAGRFRLPARSRIADVLRLAAEAPEFAGLDLAGCGIGVFGLAATADQPLNDGDRVELYRPLAVDPKKARRARARESGKRPPGAQ